MSEMFQAAILYLGMGFSVIPCLGKQPAPGIRWQEFQRRQPTLAELIEWERHGKFQNVGIVCGPVSGNLAVIDLDGIPAIRAFFAEMFTKLLITFMVWTGSGRGLHLYYRCTVLPRTQRIPGFEIRAAGCYVIAPPSIHPETGELYIPGGVKEVAHVANLDIASEWIARKGQRTASKLSERLNQPAGKRTIGFGSAYAERALTYELRDLNAVPEGSRNNRLNQAAYNLGQLVGDNLLDRSKVERELASAAARWAGMTEREALATIQSGIQAGMAEPRSAQWRKRGTL